MTTRDNVIAEARTWIGVPVEHQGRSRLGVDCVGLAVCVARALGLSNGFDVTNYPRHGSATDFAKYFEKAGARRIRVIDAKPGDIMIFREILFPCHCAILSTKRGEPTIIHAHATRGAVVEEAFDERWTRRRIAAFEVA